MTLERNMIFKNKYFYLTRKMSHFGIIIIDIYSIKTGKLLLSKLARSVKESHHIIDAVLGVEKTIVSK